MPPKKAVKAKAKAKHNSQSTRSEVQTLKQELARYKKENEQLCNENARLKRERGYFIRLVSSNPNPNFQFKVAVEDAFNDEDAARNIMLDVIDEVVAQGHQEYLFRWGQFPLSEETMMYYLGDETLEGPLLHGILSEATGFGVRDQLKVIFKLIEAGGKELLLAEDMWDRNAFFLTCEKYKCDAGAAAIVLKMLEVGGRDVVFAKSDFDSQPYNALHTLVRFLPTSSRIDEIIREVLRIGGRKVTLEKSASDDTALHIAVKKCGVPSSVIDQLIDVGGKKLLLERNRWGHLAIHCLIKNGGLDDQTFLQEQVEEEQVIDLLCAMFRNGIKLKIRGEFGFGGLFDSKCARYHQAILERWDDLIFPALEKMKNQFSRDEIPILQSALMNSAPCFIIKDIVEYFNVSCIKDSKGRYPIDVAIELGLAWDEGMKEIVEEFASEQGVNPVTLCAKRGLTWENGMKNVVEESKIEVIQEQDETSHLYPFMLAAATGSGMKYDLGSVFQLIRNSPGIVKVYENTSEDVSSRNPQNNNMGNPQNNNSRRRRSRRVQEMTRTTISKHGQGCGRGKKRRRKQS